jgi:hypothetical protein
MHSLFTEFLAGIAAAFGVVVSIYFLSLAMAPYASN